MANPDTILIVEPDPDLLAAFTAHFTIAEKFHFHVARNGKETLVAALHYRPKVILMEVQLPDQSGISVFRELKKFPRTAYIPVIFLAGGTATLLQNQVLAEGAHDFLTKPIDTAEVGLRIRNALKRSHQQGIIHPETRLPTGRLLEQKIAELRTRSSMYRMDLKLVGYEPFREMLGFLTANEVILFVSNVICDVINEWGLPEDFVGQLDNAHFVVLTDETHRELIQIQVQERLNNHLPQFYSYVEQEQGYLNVPNPDGSFTQAPLMHLQIETKRLSA